MARQKNPFRNQELRHSYRVSCAERHHGTVVRRYAFRGAEAIEAFSAAQAELVAAKKFRERFGLPDAVRIECAAERLPDVPAEKPLPVQKPVPRPIQSPLFPTSPRFIH